MRREAKIKINLIKDLIKDLREARPKIQLT